MKVWLLMAQVSVMDTADILSISGVQLRWINNSYLGVMGIALGCWGALRWIMEVYKITIQETAVKKCPRFLERTADAPVSKDNC